VNDGQIHDIWAFGRRSALPSVVGSFVIESGMPIGDDGMVVYVNGEDHPVMFGSVPAHIARETWVHIAVVLDGAGDIQAYIDNIPATKIGPIPGMPALVGQDFGTGMACPGEFNGLIDQVYAVNRALAAGDIAAMYWGSWQP
jgi:hypothetical protein